MFFLFFFWKFSFSTVTFFKTPIEKIYIKYNYYNILEKRYFKNLSFFEKFFLSLFYKKWWYLYSIAHIYDDEQIIKFRRNNHPLIDFFFKFDNKYIYGLTNLNELFKFFKIFKKRIFFKKNLRNFKRIFFKKNFFFLKFFFLKFYIFQILVSERFLNYFGKDYFLKNSTNNLIYLILIFNTLYSKSKKKKFQKFNLLKYEPWFNFVFNQSPFFRIKNRLIKIYTPSELQKLLILILFFKSFKTNYDYKKLFPELVNVKKIKSIFLLSIYFKKINKLNIKNSFIKKMNFLYSIKFNDSSVNKHLETSNFKKYNFLFLRKNRIFNKSRYSRNRQLYRTGVYWCLWVNIIFIFGLYFLFYRFSFNFGYIWWGILIFLYSTIFSRVLKYNFHNIYYIIKEIIYFLNWLGFLVKQSKRKSIHILHSLYFDKIKMRFINKKIKNIFIDFFKIFNLRLIKQIIKFKNKKDTVLFLNFWKDLKHPDTSIFKYKTFLNNIFQSLKIMIFY